MYVFLVDQRVLQGKEIELWDKLQEELRECRLLGRIEQFEDDVEVWQRVKSEMKNRQTQTIVVVGDDASFATVASAVVRSRIALGYIPFGERVDFARMLALKAELGKTGPLLANRRLKTFDLMKVDTMYALQGVHAGYLQRWYHKKKNSKDSWWQSLIKRVPGSQKMLVDIPLPSFEVKVKMKDFEITLPCSSLSLLNTNSLLSTQLGPIGVVQPDDAQLHLLAVPSTLSTNKQYQILANLDQLGNLHQKEVTHLKFDELHIKLTGIGSVLVDGWEIPDLNDFEVKVIKQGYKLIV